jgi:hypothetical protein
MTKKTTAKPVNPESQLASLLRQQTRTLPWYWLVGEQVAAYLDAHGDWGSKSLERLASRLRDRRLVATLRLAGRLHAHWNRQVVSQAQAAGVALNGVTALLSLDAAAQRIEARLQAERLRPETRRRLVREAARLRGVRDRLIRDVGAGRLTTAGLSMKAQAALKEGRWADPTHSRYHLRDAKRALTNAAEMIAERLTDLAGYVAVDQRTRLDDIAERARQLAGQIGRLQGR